MDVQTLFDNGEFDKVIDLLKDGEPNVNLAFAYQKTKQWELGMNVWNALLVKSPENADYYNERGVCKFNLRFKHAIQDFNKAVELEPNNPYRYASRAFVKDRMGDTKGGIEDYEIAVKLDPEDAISYNNLGLLQEKLGYQKSSKKNFAIADELAEENPDSLPKMQDKTENNITPEKNNFPPISPINEKTDNTFVSILKSVFTDKKTRSDFFAFIKNGFKIK